MSGFLAIDEGPRARPCIVFLHGFLGCADDWRAVVEGVRGAARCVAVDLPGHGPDPDPLPGRGHAFFQTIDALTARLELEGITRFHLLGYSMGGRLALGWVLRHPDRARSAIVIGASPGIADAGERARRAEDDRALARRLETEAFPRFLEAWYDQPLFTGMTELPGHRALLERRLRGQPGALAVAAVALGLGAQPSLWEALGASEVPVVFVAGETDARYVSIGERLAAGARSARLVAVPRASHAVHVFEPGRIAEIAVELVRSQEEDP